MRLEVPECRRCCCCVPLRRGILVFGYINLGQSLKVAGIDLKDYCFSQRHFNGTSSVKINNIHQCGIIVMFSICIVVMESVISFNEFNTTYMMAVYKGVSFYSQAWFALVLYSAEIVFNIVLLIGAHKKKTKLLRAYYYYGITTTLASLVTFIVVRHREIYSNWGYNIIECSIVFCGIGLQVYLLLLVRSELLKMRQSSRFCYVNHAAEMVVDTPLQTGRNPF